MNFMPIWIPLLSDVDLSVRRSVICPKNMRKRGKVMPDNMEAIVPMIMYLRSDWLAYLKIERNFI